MASSYRLEDGAISTDVTRGGEAETTNKTGAEIAGNVTIQVREHQHLELLGCHHQLHEEEAMNATLSANTGRVQRRRTRSISITCMQTLSTEISSYSTKG
jgi:hypothetical protein